MEKKLKNIFIIITIIIMIPVTLAALIWLLVNIGSNSFILKLMFAPIQLTFIVPIIKWGIIIILAIWIIYGIIRVLKKDNNIEKI